MTRHDKRHQGDIVEHPWYQLDSKSVFEPSNNLRTKGYGGCSGASIQAFQIKYSSHMSIMFGKVTRVSDRQ